MIFADGFCSGLKPSKVNILLETYKIERESKKDVDEYLDYLKRDNLNEYNEFVVYKHLVEKRTPNLREIYYEFLDGKREDMDWDLFFQ